MSQHPQPSAPPSTDETARLNNEIRYVQYAVFSLAPFELADQTPEEVAAVVEQELAEAGVTVRGWYDVSGFRAEADLLVWWHGPTVEAVQQAYRSLTFGPLGGALAPVWSSIGLHRPAEFNRSHVPAFLAGEEPGDYLCVYPFVRSYDWYLLDPAERGTMLRDHGLAAKGYADVRANTVACFGLNDYEWLLAFEAPQMHRIVDLMRELRATEARRHVREETPFFAGRRLPLVQWLQAYADLS